MKKTHTLLKTVLTTGEYIDIMSNFEYKIYREVYDNMLTGIKKVEIRLLNEKSSKIKIGDKIKFSIVDDENTYLNVRVTNLYHFNNVEDL